MHARHYSPALGRFLQPDPDGSEANLYAYTANNPVTELDPSGTCFILCAVLVAALLFGSLGAATEVATYAASTPQDQWSPEAAGDAALWGGASGAFLAVPAPGGRIVGSALARALAKVPKAARAAKAGENAAREVAKAVQTGASRIPTRADQIKWQGGEVVFSRDFRIKPLLTPLARDSMGVWRSWAQRLPHYHRRGPGGIDRHRPWDSKPGDTRWTDRL